MAKKKAAGDNTPAALDALTLRKPGNPIEANKPVCGAKLRKKDKTCGVTQLLLNGKCRLHGGKSPSGIASPHHKHGRFSRVMPRHLADRYEEIKADPDLISNRRTLAYTETLLEERIKDIYAGCPPKAWELAKHFLKDYEDLLVKKDEFEPIYNRKGDQINKEPDPEEALAALRDLLRIGIRSSEAFELTAHMVEQHRRAVDTEYKLIKDSQTRMDVSEARMLAQGLADAVKRHVKDPETLRLIQADMRRLISAGPDHGA